MKEISEVLNQTIRILESHIVEKEQKKEIFNIFSVLELTTDEVNLHSKFIGELLNPKGTHLMGDIFLKRFISVISDKVAIDKFNTQTAIIEIEKLIGEKTETEGGRIDIILTDINKHSIIIENKIYAPEQVNQLLRYNNYKGCKSKTLLYLTLDGKSSQNESYSKNYPDFYTCISYSFEIIKWLEECIDITKQYHNIQEVIKQYHKIINQITGKNMDKSLINELNSLTASNENFLKASVAIAESIESTKINIQKKFWHQIEIKAKDKFDNIWSNLKEAKWDKKNEFHRIEITLNNINENEKVVFAIESFDNLYFGFKYITGISHDCSNILIEKYIIAAENTTINKKDKNWIRWDYPNFNEFHETNRKLNLAFNCINYDNDLVFLITDDNKLNAIIESILNESQEKIIAFCNELNIPMIPVN
jgi:hypothetical protein